MRGLGAMVGIEFILDDAHTPNSEATQKMVDYAREQGLILLPTGTYSNVIRLLPPINMSDEEMEEGLAILEQAIELGLEAVTA